MDATRTMEQLLAAVELSQSLSEATTPTATTTISIWSTPSEGSGSSSADRASFRFRLDGQNILPPLMTSAKRHEVQLARQMALKLEERYRLARNSAGSDMAGRRSLSQLQQTETFIYDSTQRQAARPQSLTLNIQLPTIQVDPPTPQPPLEPVEQVAPMENVSPRRHNRITDRILQFEQSGLGRMLPKVQDQRILRSSTSPSIAAAVKDQPLELREKAQLTTPPKPEEVGFQRSRSFTLDEPSQVLVEHMQREALAVRPSNSLANFQRQTIESQAKRVNRSPRRSTTTTTTTTTTTASTASTPTALATTSSCSRRDREVERIIEKALGEHCTLEASRRAGVRNYLRGHRERMNQLVLYQEEERRRMQSQFDLQQRQLIEELCAEIDDSSGTENPDGLVLESTPTPTLTPTMSVSLSDTPRTLQELDDFLPTDNSCQMPRAPSSARKRLFSPKHSLGYESEPQQPGAGSALSTPRSLPLRNSSLTNSRRSGQAVRRRSQTVGSSPRKLNSGAAGREVIKAPAQAAVGGGRPRSSQGGGGSSTIPKKGSTPARSSSPTKQRLSNSPTKRMSNRKKS
ncbi:uncharacterized protein LOC108140871 isoform X2 [Drosophila elegans]|uniref:uncharacterized protein LOC108140871 isoform X2 n=1 Tax=Drosophila elegans TaxID=30023 RepID=UPI0007E8A5EC|nr:uncharacterized protein LOC108140871 isoform X2 [Drosophila elegans]